jgi:hypothetical protein
MDPTETPTANQLSSGLDTLNLMLDSWGGESLLPVAQIRESFTLTANQSNYTVGPTGANLTTGYIFNISSGFIRDSNNYDSTLTVVPREAYDSHSDKAVSTNTAVPRELFYDPGVTQEANSMGTIYLYPTPDAAYTLFVESNKGFSQYANLSDSINFPPGWKRALVYSLCIELATAYGRDVPPEILKIAKDSLDIIKNINARNKTVRSSFSFPSGQSRSFNILSGM